MFCKVWFYKWLCECFHIFSISCFEGSTCLTYTEFGTVLTFKFVDVCFCCLALCVLFARCVIRVCAVIFVFLQFSVFMCCTKQCTEWALTQQNPHNHNSNSTSITGKTTRITAPSVKLSKWCTLYRIQSKVDSSFPIENGMIQGDALFNKPSGN